ncbi:hypothetical protein HY256_07525 [Candidatus Sumerlaeota bacterium]|nr:hypothetical protein [Candidatus Sumerlaeota bacterium]
MGLHENDTQSDPQAANQTGIRFLRFPDDRSLGVILMRQWESPADAPWKVLDDARGVVETPMSMELKLRVSPEGAQNLAPLCKLGPAALHSVDLWESGVHDDQLVHLASLHCLQGLVLARTNIGDAGIAHIRYLTLLKTLSLYQTLVTDAGLEAIKDMISLETLWLNKSHVSNLALQYLKQLTALKELYVADTKISYVGRAMLKKALPHCKIRSGKGSMWSY